MVGFCGARSLPGSFSSLVSSAVRSLPGPVAVGCAAGADRLVRGAAGGRARVFRVASFVRSGLPFAGALAARSAAFVRAVAVSSSPLLVAFVSAPCPAFLRPSSSPAACFCGLGSGSWASLALAVGLGVPVRVFVCGGGRSALPASWGSWSRCAAGGVWAGAWVLAPCAAQLPLFA